MSEERGSGGERGRWSSRRKTEVVLRALRGEDLDCLSREPGVTVGARDRGVAALGLETDADTVSFIGTAATLRAVAARMAQRAAELEDDDGRADRTAR